MHIANKKWISKKRERTMQKDNVKWLKFISKSTEIIVGVAHRSIDNRYINRYVISNGTMQIQDNTSSADSFENALLQFYPGIDRKLLEEVSKPSDFDDLKKKYEATLGTEFKCRASALV